MTKKLGTEKHPIVLDSDDSASSPPEPVKKKARTEKPAVNNRHELLTIEERYALLSHSFDPSKKDEEEMDLNEEDGSNEDEDVGLKAKAPSYGLQSKMISCAILHEYIYHVVHGIEEQENVPSLYDRFPLDEPLPDTDECTPLESLPVVDREAESPFKHVVRLPQFKNISRGWFIIRDLVLGMPLSVFVLIVKLKHSVKGLQELLDDPHRRHLPLADLPINIRRHLFSRASCTYIEYLCKILSAMGLMRASPIFKGKTSLYVGAYTDWTNMNLFFNISIILFINLISINYASKLAELLNHKLKVHSLPFNNSEEAVVRVGIYIENFGKFHSSEMSFDLDFYMYCNWRDRKLSHSSPNLRLINNPEFLSSIWRPDLYLSNSRNSKFHDILAPNFNLFIDSNGNIAYSCRITATISCTFELDNYPMDSQKCHLRIVTYAYISKQVKVMWFLDDPIRYPHDIRLPEFNLESIYPSYCNGTYKYAIMEDSYKRENFGCIQANIVLRRSVAYHIVNSYVPCAFIVMISTVSFWLDRKAIHARITLWFTTMLSLYMVSHSGEENIPQVSSIKALDIYFGSCLLFIVSTLLETAVVNKYIRKAEEYERMARSMATLSAPTDDYRRYTDESSSCSSSHNVPLHINNITISYFAENLKESKLQKSARIQELQIGYEYSRKAFHIDQFSRILLPLIFSIFNTIYWIYYLSK